MPNNPSHRAIRLLRRHHQATLSFGDRRASVRFVIDGTNGQLVLPVETTAARAADVLLHMPTEPDCDLQVMAAATPIARPEIHAGCDRWAAYHGVAPSSSVWITARIEGAKAADAVFSTEEFEKPPALPREGPVIKLANSDRARLSAVCAAAAGMNVADPLCVGIDPLGIDIRARFGIVRVEFSTPIIATELAAVESEFLDRLMQLLSAPPKLSKHVAGPLEGRRGPV